MAGGGEVKKGVFGGNPWVGGGDDKMISPLAPGGLPSEGEGEVVVLFWNVKFVKGDRVTDEGEGNKIAHNVHLAHTLPGLIQPLPPHNP